MAGKYKKQRAARAQVKAVKSAWGHMPWNNRAKRAHFAKFRR